MSMAKACIEECVRTHTKCQAITTYPIGSALLPTRLIDCSNPDRLRIVETNPDMRGLYVALSYVWGEPQPHRTTKANLTYYKVRIDSAILPQTIRDAVWVTRALGIGWLWIDSICIIQDSEKDWEQESERMSHVYQNGFCNIVTAYSDGPDGGLFSDRDPARFQPFTPIPLGSTKRPLTLTLRATRVTSRWTTSKTFVSLAHAGTNGTRSYYRPSNYTSPISAPRNTFDWVLLAELCSVLLVTIPDQQQIPTSMT